MDKKYYDALTSSIYANCMAAAGKTITTDDQRLRASGLYSDWAPGAHKAGDIYNAEGQTWECIQDYDNAVYPALTPTDPSFRTFNRPYHGKTARTARPFVAPTGAHDRYLCGEWAIWDGVPKECIDPNGTAYSPADYPDAWS